MIELDWLHRWNMYSPHSIALQDGETKRSYTYAQLYEMAQRGASVLQQHYQICHGDRVAVLATNELEYIFLFFALQRLGAVLVPLNFRLTPRELDHLLKDSQPKLLLFQEDFKRNIEGLEQKNFTTALFHGPGSFTEFLQQSALYPVPFQGAEEDPVMILYTSGTTGTPKGAVITHKMIFWNSVNTSMRLNLSQKDCAVIFLPFFHTGGWNVLTTPFIHHGGKLVFIKKFDAEKILQLSEQEKATILFGVPTTMDLMAQTPIFSKVDLSSMRYAIVGGEPMPLNLIKIWHEKGVPIRQGYGLTEFGPGVFSLNETDALRKIGSIGFPNFYCQVKIINPDGSEVGDDQVGELLLRGPAAMAGYWNNPQATAEAFRNGWLATGDLARRDHEGYYYIVGRKKDMFISGGENVYPVEIEQVLRMHPGVAEVAVIGVPDNKWGEVGKAFVVRGCHDLSLADLQQHCQKNLAKFKVPKHFVFLESLPKGESGKVLKKALPRAAEPAIQGAP